MTWPDFKKVLEGTKMPLAFVDLDALESNMEAVIKRSGGLKIRIATKSIRSVPILKRILSSHPAFTGLMSFSGDETLRLCEAGFTDILVGYPVVNEETLKAIARKIKEGTNISLMADSEAHLLLLNRIASGESVKMQVCLDVDLSSDFGSLHFGVYRSSLRKAGEVAAMAAYARSCSNLTLIGLMGYEAQLSGVPDRAPRGGMKNMLIRRFKRKSERDIAQKWEEISRLLPDFSSLEFVNGGGTGSLEFTSKLKEVTEITVGSAFFAPALFDHYDSFRHHPAVGFALEITRMPEAGIYTCSGGGYIASGPTSDSKLPLPWLPAGMKLLPHEGAGEVQTPVKYTGIEKLGLGDPLIFRHAKAGEICERFNTLLMIRNGQMEGEVKTYRGEGWSFI